MFNLNIRESFVCILVRLSIRFIFVYLKFDKIKRRLSQELKLLI